MVVPPSAQVCSGLILRTSEPDLEDDKSEDEAKIAWKALMKESITQNHCRSVYCMMCLIDGGQIQLDFL